MVGDEPVLKMLEDMCGAPETVNLFYSNDVHVILDVILRELANREPGDPKRLYMLRIASAYFINSDYGAGADEPYKIAKFQATFDAIHSEEGPESEMARLMVENIYMTCDVVATWRPS